MYWAEQLFTHRVPTEGHSKEEQAVPGGYTLSRMKPSPQTSAEKTPPGDPLCPVPQCSVPPMAPARPLWCSEPCEHSVDCGLWLSALWEARQTRHTRSCRRCVGTATQCKVLPCVAYPVSLQDMYKPHSAVLVGDTICLITVLCATKSSQVLCIGESFFSSH